MRVSKLDDMDAYHRGTLHPSQVGTFSYVVPMAPDDDGIIICINMVFLMVWVDSPKFFCAFYKIITDVVSDLVDTRLPVP